MKIFYDLVVADNFEVRHYPLPWPVGTGNLEYVTGLEINFAQKTGDNMKDANAALKKYMKKNYPKREYKICYWTWA